MLYLMFIKAKKFLEINLSGGRMDRINNYILRNILNSDVENTEIFDCFFNFGSFDQIEASSFNAKAKNGESFRSGDNLIPSSLYSLKYSISFIVKKLLSSSIICLTSFSDVFVYFDKSEILFISSSIAYSGVKISKPKDFAFNIIYLTGFSRKKENKAFVSATKFIYQPSFLYRFSIFSFALSPSFKHSSSVNSEFSSILSSFLNRDALLIFSDKNTLTASDQFNSGRASMFFFRSSEIETVMFGILILSHYLLYSVCSLLFKSFGGQNG